MRTLRGSDQGQSKTTNRQAFEAFGEFALTRIPINAATSFDEAAATSFDEAAATSFDVDLCVWTKVLDF